MCICCDFCHNYCVCQFVHKIPFLAVQTRVAIIGGWSGSFLSSTEIYPSGSCSIPDLPAGTSGHSAFVTNSELTGWGKRVVICGGSTTATESSCFALNVVHQMWEDVDTNFWSNGKLSMPRTSHAAVSFENIGTYLIGGAKTSNKRTTDFLGYKAEQWTAGPDIPVDMVSPCAVRISELSFLTIYGKNIREYQVDVSHPTSNNGWQSPSKFPQLQTARSHQPGCSKIGDKVVIGGGKDPAGGTLRSTEILNLLTRTISYAGDMTSPRQHFDMAKVWRNGREILLAFGGLSVGPSGGTELNSVEEFDTSSNTWTRPLTLQENRVASSAVALPTDLFRFDLVCPT